MERRDNSALCIHSNILFMFLMIMIPKVAAEKGISQLSTESGISYMQNKCL